MPRHTPTQPFCIRPQATLAVLAMVASACSSSIDDELFFGTTPGTTVNAGSLYTYDASVSAPDESVTYSVTNGPAAMSVSATGLVSWATGPADAGPHSIELRAMSGSKSGKQSWTLTVASAAPIGGGGPGDALAGQWRSGRSANQGSPMAAELLELEHSREPRGIPQLSRWSMLGGLSVFTCHWRDSLDSSGAIPGEARLAWELVEERRRPAAICFSWMDDWGIPDLANQGRSESNSWSNSDSRADLLRMVEAFTGLYEPSFLILGNEVDEYCTLQDSLAWIEWQSLLEDVRTVVAIASPGTVVL